jgi:hypothetical protein
MAASIATAIKKISHQNNLAKFIVCIGCFDCCDYLDCADSSDQYEKLTGLSARLQNSLQVPNDEQAKRFTKIYVTLGSLRRHVADSLAPHSGPIA